RRAEETHDGCWHNGAVLAAPQPHPHLVTRFSAWSRALALRAARMEADCAIADYCGGRLSRNRLIAHGQADSLGPSLVVRFSLVLLRLFSAPAHADGRAKRIAGVVTTLAGAVLIVAAAALGNQAVNDSDTVTLLFQSGGVWNRQARDLADEGRSDQLALSVL